MVGSGGQLWRNFLIFAIFCSPFFAMSDFSSYVLAGKEIMSDNLGDALSMAHGGQRYIFASGLHLHSILLAR